MDCWRRFEFKYVLHYANHARRKVLLERELSRVGMDDVWWFVDAPSPFIDLLKKNVKTPWFMKKGEWGEHFFNVTMGHYRMINAAYHMGCKSLLAMENDIRFMKDTRKLNEAVEELPDTYDIALFDWEVVPSDKQAYTRELDVLRSQHGTGFWKKLNDKVDLRSFACRAYSRKGMRRFLDFIESAIKNNHDMHVLDADLAPSERHARPVEEVYFAWPNIAIQSRIDDERGRCDSDIRIMRREAIGCFDTDYGS